jgi:hypothetical protein
MHRKSLLAVAVCTGALAALSAAPAFAGEVKGPPGGGTDFTAARTQANSICAFSGLNDFTQGHESFHVQSYGIDVSGKGELPFGQPGQDCRGFSNPYNPPG